jgi:hypothetical protein
MSLGSIAGIVLLFVYTFMWWAAFYLLLRGGSGTSNVPRATGVSPLLESGSIERKY